LEQDLEHGLVAALPFAILLAPTPSSSIRRSLTVRRTTQWWIS